MYICIYIYINIYLKTNIHIYIWYRCTYAYIDMSLYVYILCHQEKNSVGFPSVSGEMPENIHISLKVYTKNC